MKITKRQLRRIIRESRADDEVDRGWRDFHNGLERDPNGSDWYQDGYDEAKENAARRGDETPVMRETSNWKPLSREHEAELDPKTRPAAGQEKSEESIAEITKALYRAIRNRDALNAESTWDDDKLYIMTGEEQGITVQVLGRGRPRFGK